ncbi:hypothetical protein [Dyadobacter jiangsuensis]|uniref:Uncharacterized protein n=1 Tax=Dyadobacter jiangsuensis TaxID=1591085 RepID=A0A2P8FP73_9BACT|nr:hypothetical protein [Dyadobacter jiangsuensis]PSL23493.1 hypothetical protein CLV60_11648 [Dyadobacter jiangsuensis]
MSDATSKDLYDAIIELRATTDKLVEIRASLPPMPLSMESYNHQSLLAMDLGKYADDLAEAIKPFAGYECSPPGECDCYNCIARDKLAAYNEFKKGISK